MSKRNKLLKFAELLTLPNVYENFDPKLPELAGLNGLPADRKGCWAQQHFGNTNPITLELACGRGEYSLDLAEFAARGDGQVLNNLVAPEKQREALTALLKTLAPQFLEVPKKIIRLIPPQPEGYQRDRELFKVYTGPVFDPLEAAERSAEHTLSFVLNPARLARLVEQQAQTMDALSVGEVIDQLRKACNDNIVASPMQQEIGRITEKLLLYHL